MIRMGGNITSESGGGNITYNNSTNEIDINVAFNDYSTVSNLAHELTHGFQFHKNQLGFQVGRDRSGKFLVSPVHYDVTDEDGAFERGEMYDSKVKQSYEGLSRMMFIMNRYSKTLNKEEQHFSEDKLKNNHHPMQSAVKGYDIISSGYRESHKLLSK